MSASYWAGCVRPVMISNPLRGMEILMTHNLSISPSLTVVPVFSVRILRDCTVAPKHKIFTQIAGLSPRQTAVSQAVMTRVPGPICSSHCDDRAGIGALRIIGGGVGELRYYWTIAASVPFSSFVKSPIKDLSQRWAGSLR